jgi:hypothetical protein
VNVTDYPLTINDEAVNTNDRAVIVNGYPLMITGCPLTVNDGAVTVTDCPLTVAARAAGVNGRVWHGRFGPRFAFYDLRLLRPPGAPGGSLPLAGS